MNKPMFLSQFTPSMTDPEVLESIFVQREATLKRTVEQVVTSVKTKAKHHSLFIGPRGIGKTHFISLLFYRLKKNPDIRKGALVAWLHEEEWGVTSFLELLIRILKMLDGSYQDLKLEGKIAAIYDNSPDAAKHIAEALLLKALNKRTLVLLVENLDELFQQLGDKGQREWRAFLQNNPICTTVATAPSLFSGVSQQKSPFFGFFRTEPFLPLEFEDVVSLLEKIAKQRGDESLVKALQSPHGRARLRAVHHLAEGNPRIYIVFSQFLTAQTLEVLVDAFLRTLDELTPYYQSRMKDLSAQQRKIVEFLCDYQGAAPVKEIAHGCFITHQTCSSQLKELRNRGYAKSRELGRESYYELTEPLMRICLDVKKQRGEPIGLFVQILRIWYSQPELSNWHQRLGDQECVDKAYIEKALELAANDKVDPKIAPVKTAFESELAAEKYQKCEQTLAEWHALASDADPDYQFARWTLEDAREEYEKALSIGHTLMVIGHPLGVLGVLKPLLDLEEWSKLVEFLGSDQEITLESDRGNLAVAYASRGIAFRHLDRSNEAIRDFQKAAKLEPKERAWCLETVAYLYEQQGALMEAIKTFRQLRKVKPRKSDYVFRQYVLLLKLERNDEANDVALELANDKFSNTAWGRIVQLFVFKKNDFSWVQAADDYAEFAKDKSTHSIFVLAIAKKLGRVDQTTLASAVEYLIKFPQAWKTDVLQAISTLYLSGYSGAQSLLASFARVADGQETAIVAAAILSSIRHVVEEGNSVSLDQGRKWLEALRVAFPESPANQPIGRSLMLADTYLEWKSSGKEQALLRLPEEERRLLTDAVPPSGLAELSAIGDAGKAT